MQYQNILIDVSNFFFRNYSIYNKEKLINGEEEIAHKAILGFFFSIKKIQRLFAESSTNWYFLFDNPSSGDLVRKEIDPDYKISRKKYNKDFYNSIKYISFILLNYSSKFNIVQYPKIEADDIPPTIISHIGNEESILLISADLDFSRCLSKNCSWYNFNRIYTPEIFEEKYEFYPTTERIILMKSIRGDKSDNIPIAVKGIKNKDLLYLIKKYNSVYNMINNIYKEKGIISDTFIDKIIENKNRIILNSQLVSFINISYDNIKDYIFPGSYNPNTLKFYYDLLKIDIQELDPRVLEDLNKEIGKSSKNFIF